MKTFGHIINPVIVDKSADLYRAQPITFETMRIARDFALDVVEVRLLTAQYPEDRALAPAWFQPTPDLDRSILDIGTFQKERKLPLLVDIFNRFYTAAPDADYMIYSNVDIALMPHFYLAVKRFIDAGYDAFAINRRTISENFTGIEDIPFMFSEVGEEHPGHDCFVFKRDIHPRFILGDVCIGINWVGRVLLWNLICHSQNFNEFKSTHLTFHLGNDKKWEGDGHSDYAAHNKREALKVLAELERQYGPFDRNKPIYPYIHDAIADDSEIRGGGGSAGMVQRIKTALKVKLQRSSSERPG
jgi:hypothetical protein